MSLVLKSCLGILVFAGLVFAVMFKIRKQPKRNRNNKQKFNSAVKSIQSAVKDIVRMS